VGFWIKHFAVGRFFESTLRKWCIFIRRGRGCAFFFSLSLSLSLVRDIVKCFESKLHKLLNNNLLIAANVLNDCIFRQAGFVKSKKSTPFSLFYWQKSDCARGDKRFSQNVTNIPDVIRPKSQLITKWKSLTIFLIVPLFLNQIFYSTWIFSYFTRITENKSHICQTLIVDETKIFCRDPHLFDLPQISCHLLPNKF